MIIPSDLYAKIIRVMPIPCIDLLVMDHQGKILLIKRKNEPARGLWWFPGGRVRFNETRRAAAARILMTETNLESEYFTELGTFDVLLDVCSENRISHGISTLLHATVGSKNATTLDDQSLTFEWRVPSEWRKENLHSFVDSGILQLKNVHPKS